MVLTNLLEFTIRMEYAHGDGVPVTKCSGVRVSSNKTYALILYSTIAFVHQKT